MNATILVFGIKNSNPPKYALYDCADPIGARSRIEAKHPEYIFLGEEPAREDAKEFTRAFNKTANLYPHYAAKFKY